MRAGSLAKHGVYHQGDQHLPVLGPVIKLLTMLANAFCL
jgi:hypothetical protein